MPRTQTSLNDIKFKAKQVKRNVARLARTGWYKLVRRHFEVIAWHAWNQFHWLDDKLISRRNAINRLDSLTLIEVEPGTITSYVQAQDVDRKHFFWHGDWDLRSLKMMDHQRYQLMNDLWEHRTTLQQSRTYRQMLGNIRQGIYHNHFNRGITVDSPESALKLLKSQCQIYDSLISKGYRADLATDEIKVAVDRYGNLIKANGGRKRLSAAIICGLPSIPVRIAYVHEQWLKKHHGAGKKKQQALRKALQAIHQKHSVASFQRDPPPPLN
ncbi:MAG: hypothetical protein RI567_02195 [Marinobacter sp.]|nr:hypothetical protein [Marinobacter sp.]